MRLWLLAAPLFLGVRPTGLPSLDTWNFLTDLGVLLVTLVVQGVF